MYASPRWSRRPGYHPELLLLEERLPLGDGVLGLLVGAALLPAHAEPPAAAEPSTVAVGRPSQAVQAVRATWEGRPMESHALAWNGDGPTALSAPTWDALTDPSASAARRQRGIFSGSLQREQGLDATSLLALRAPEAAARAGALFTPYTLAPTPRSDEVLLMLLAGQQTSVLAAASDVTPAQEAQVKENFGKLPLYFEENVGQADASVHFFARGPGYGLYLTGTEAVLVLSKATPPETSDPLASGGVDPRRVGLPAGINRPEEPTAAVRLQVLGANPAPAVSGRDEQPGKVNYFLGNDPAQWRTNIATFGRVEYDEVYPGIDLVYYGNQRQLEYDFVVSPGADPSMIRLNVSGAERVELDTAGDLLIHAGEPGGVSPRSPLRQHKPFVYQEVNGTRREVASRFVLDGSQVRFTVGTYDRGRPLVIDPVLNYSTYLGGSNVDIGYGLAVDPTTGEMLVTGYTNSIDFATAFPLQGSFRGTQDIFVARLSAAGSALVYSTYLGGNNGDHGRGIAVDPVTGDAFITGATASPNFPTANPLQATCAGCPNNGDAFVARLATTGSALVFSTYLGGSLEDAGLGIAFDSTTGSTLVTGYTLSTNFPTANPFQPGNRGGRDAFVARLDATGTGLIYSTYLGGSTNFDAGHALVVDPATGDTLLTGFAASADFPTSNPFQATNRGRADVIVLRLNSLGTALLWSTYLGGSSDDVGYGIALDPSTGDVLITGTTSSLDFPTADPLQLANRGLGDAFVTRVRSNGQGLVWSTYLGGSSSEVAYGIALDHVSGDTLITGYTWSTDFPLAHPLQTALRGQRDAFVARLDATGSTLVWSTYLGGSGGGSGTEAGYAIAVDPRTGDALVLGYTDSTDFPTASPLQPFRGGDGIHKSTNGAGSWRASNTNLPTSNVLTLAADPNNPATVYVGTLDRGVFKSTNGGASWSSSSTGLTNLQVRHLVIDPVESNTLYAGTWGGIFKSTNGGASWVPINAGITDLMISVVAINPASSNIVYAGTWGSGVFKSTNGGASWSPTNTGLTALTIKTLVIDPSNPATVYLGAWSRGIFKSTNGGSTWDSINTGIPSDNGTRINWALAIDPSTPAILYAGVRYELCQGPCYSYEALFKSTNGGSSWFNLRSLLSPIHALLMDPAVPSTVYAGTRDGIFKSTDSGGTWTYTGLAHASVLALAPSAPATLYAATIGNFNEDAFLTRIGSPPAVYYYVYPNSGPVQAGISVDFSVFALDAQFNLVPDCTGLLLFFTTDEQATTPVYYQFQRSDRGVAYFPGGLTFRTPGRQELYVLDWPGVQAFGYAAFDVS